MNRQMRVTLMVPTADTEETYKCQMDTEKGLLDIAGGFTCVEVRGAYKMKDGTEVYETMSQYTILMGATMDNERAVVKLAHNVKKEFKQEAVFCLVEYVDTDGQHLV